MNHCQLCNAATKNKKYCSRDCANNVNNKIHSSKRAKQQPQKSYLCKKCGKFLALGHKQLLTTGNGKVCTQCNSNIKDWATITKAEFAKDRSLNNFHGRLRQLARRVYERSNKPQLCTKCSYSKHFQVCHLKPVASFGDNSTIAEINHLDNLIALCPNCHWEMDHN